VAIGALELQLVTFWTLSSQRRAASFAPNGTHRRFTTV